jgi:hypothetical protein
LKRLPSSRLIITEGIVMSGIGAVKPIVITAGQQKLRAWGAVGVVPAKRRGIGIGRIADEGTVAVAGAFERKRKHVVDRAIGGRKGGRLAGAAPGRAMPLAIASTES